MLLDIISFDIGGTVAQVVTSGVASAPLLSTVWTLEWVYDCKIGWALDERGGPSGRGVYRSSIFKIPCFFILPLFFKINLCLSVEVKIAIFLVK